MAYKKSLPKEKFYKPPEVTEDDDADSEEYVIVPPDGGWGWVVVLAAFYINIVIDGVLYTFGIFLQDLSDYFQTEKSKVSLIYSILFGTHFIMGVACAGFSNVFGIRIVTCSGALISAFAFGISSVVESYKVLCFTYGFIGGIGFGLMLMNGLIAPTIYFERWRGLAVGITMMGTGVGAILFPFAGNHIHKVATWQTAFQAQAIAAGSLFFAGLTFRPLKPKRIVGTEAVPSFTIEQTKTVIQHDDNHPEQEKHHREQEGHSSQDTHERKTSEHKAPKIYFKKTIYDGPTRSVSMAHFSAAALQEAGVETSIRGVSGRLKKKMEQKTGESSAQRSQDVLLVNSETKQDMFREDSPFKSSTSSQSAVRPRFFQKLARDSTTYIYSRASSPTMSNKGREFCAPFFASIKNMLNCKVLKNPAYCVFAVTGATSACGLIIIMTYQQDRAVLQGFDSDTATYFVMVFGAANTLWRLFLGIISVFPQTNLLYGLVMCTILGGLAALISGLSLHLAYQYMFSITAGLAFAAFAVLRPIIMVELVGLTKVSNATGIQFLMMGIGAILGPPLSGLVMEATDNFNSVFYIAGILITSSGFVVSLTGWLHKKEESEIKEPKELV